MQVALAKSQSVREDLTSQLSWAAVWLLVIFGSPVYIVVADEFSTYLLWPLVIGIMVVLLTFFFPCQCGSTRGELMLFQGMGMESKDKIALYCSREKCRWITVRGRGGTWNSHDTSHERWCYKKCGIHVGKYLVHARLDYWILSQDCRNTLPWHKLLN